MTDLNVMWDYERKTGFDCVGKGWWMVEVLRTVSLLQKLQDVWGGCPADRFVGLTVLSKMKL